MVKSFLAALLLLPTVALAAPGAHSNCSGSSGVSAANITFPAAGSTGPTTANAYIWLQNTSLNTLCYNTTGAATISGTNCTGASHVLSPGAGFIWSGTDPIPPTISLIASSASSSFACDYQ